MRILVVSAAIAALTVPPVQAAGPSLWQLFSGCSFSPVTQCAKNITHGNGNKATIAQDQWLPGFQFGFQTQDGNGNSAYTGQKGTDQFALTVQKGDGNRSYTGQNGSYDFAVTAQLGDGNTAGTHQEGTNLAAATIQTGSNGWSTIGMSGNGGIAVVTQSN